MVGANAMIIINNMRQQNFDMGLFLLIIGLSGVLLIAVVLLNHIYRRWKGWK